MEKKYYELLEINKNASQEIIEKAYKTLVKKYHPDLQPNNQKSFFEEKIKQINEAYEVLSNPEKRKEYDKLLEETDNERLEKLYNENIYLKNKFHNNSSINNYNQTYNPSTYYTNQNNNEINSENNIRNSNANYYENNIKNNNTNYYENNNITPNNLKYSIKNRINYYKQLLKYKFRNFLTSLTAIIIIIVIIYILWHIPVVKSYLISLYNDNIVIKTIVDLITNLFSSK